MKSMENEACVENKECGNAEMQSVWQIRSVENVEYGKCRVCVK